MKTITDLRDCYGKLFPDFARLKRGEQQDGQAFSAVITGCGTGSQGRNLAIKTEAWLKCSECPDYTAKSCRAQAEHERRPAHKTSETGEPIRRLVLGGFGTLSSKAAPIPVRVADASRAVAAARKAERGGS